MKWIKRIKTDLGEYDVKISEPWLYEYGMFRVRICTTKHIWWYPRFELMTFDVNCADCDRENCDPVEAAKQRIAAYEIEEEKYLKVVRRLNDNEHET